MHIGPTYGQAVKQLFRATMPMAAVEVLGEGYHPSACMISVWPLWRSLSSENLGLLSPGSVDM